MHFLQIKCDLISSPPFTNWSKFGFVCIDSCLSWDDLLCKFCKVITGGRAPDTKQTPLIMKIAMYGPKMLFLGEFVAKCNQNMSISEEKSAYTALIFHWGFAIQVWSTVKLG